MSFSDSTASDSTQKKEDIKNEINNYLCLGVKSSENLGWTMDDTFQFCLVFLRNASVVLQHLSPQRRLLV